MAAEMDIRLHVLEKITKNFSVDLRIGRGGYGDVYKGVLCDQELIAVKLLHDSVERLDDELFKNEVGNLLTVEHPNIVQFLGYCYETRSKYVKYNGQNRFSKHIHRVLCFEYLQGGSLDKRLHEQSLAPTWSTHYNIIKGICEGLNFLHGHEPQILHLDLKPANILLDSNMTPKVADFGLSRLFGGSHTHVTRKMIGTEKYMSPESINECIISPKNDIFSLGVVIIEIMAGPSGYSDFQEDVPKFIHEVLNKWSNIIEPTMEYRPQLLLQVKTCIDTAMRCVDSQRENRPTIASILDIFNEIETDIPNAQLAVMPPSRTIDIKNSLAETLKKMTADPDNITNSVANMEHVPKIREASSNVEEPFIIEETEDRETSSYVEEGLIIGRTEERKKILSILSESSTMEMVILPIYGIGGIGKTTLAQLVFSDTQFSGYSQVWVYVSEHLDLYKIGNSIISQLSKGDSNIANMQIIHNRLGELFADKRILIVLDDMWEDKPRELDKLKAMLRLGKGRKVIIVTTRDEAIARIICSTVKNVPYKLESLSDDMCWAIIKQKSEFENHADKNFLEQIGREIAVKCGGVALAAQSLGYMLRYMTSDQWESVRDSDIWNISTFEDPSLTTNEVLASLRLSYSHMHKFLRICFSYCAVFPKGYLIAKYDLIYQWIALGFPQPSEIFDSMQICEQYVTQLLGMSFLQYSNTPLGEGPDAKYFRMHDLVHDLARAMLADKVNKNGIVVGSSCQYALLTDPSNPLQSFLSSPKNLKALHYLDGAAIDLSDGAISAAERLVVLDLKGCFIRKLPDSIGQLKQLRYLRARRIQDQRIPTFLSELSKLNYLSLRHSRMKTLPDSVGDMEGLMYLDLSGCDRLSELPVSFADLKQLVHLDLSYCPVHISESWGSFTKLQHLNLSKRSSMDLPLLSKPMEYQDFKLLAQVIGNLTKLQYLNLSFSIRSDHTRVLPDLKVFRKLTKLRYLNLAGCMEMVSEADILGLLVGISTLYNLEHLDLSDSKQLNGIPESVGNLTKLHTLDISGCNVRKLPSWMAKMASLKIVNMKTLHECGSNLNLILLVPNTDKLKISKLEDVKSLEEARRVKLIDKWKLGDLTLEWTVGCQKRFVDDKDVLEVLVPPDTIKSLNITGYMSLSLSTNWLMGIGQYIPRVTEITLKDLPNCNNLPPLGQLPQLRNLSLHRLDSLEELNTTDSSGELVFPNLDYLDIMSCPRLRLKKGLPRALSTLNIIASDNMLTSFGECVSQTSASSSSSLLCRLLVEGSKVPLYQWRLLQHVSAQIFIVSDCSEMANCIELASCSPGVIQSLSSVISLELKHEILTELPTWLLELTSLRWLTIRGCGRMVSLPQWLGELTSVEKIYIFKCEGIRSLPGSIRKLTKLRTLQIDSDNMRYSEIRRMFSSISADTDEVDIHKLIEEYKKEESKAWATYVEDINNTVTSADAHGDPSVHTAAVTYANAEALVCSPPAICIESYSAAKTLSDQPADAVNTSAKENMTHKRRVGQEGSAGPDIVEASGQAEKRPRHLVPDASASTTSSQDTSSGSRINNIGTTSPDVVIMPTDVVPDAAATDIVPSLSSPADEPDSTPWCSSSWAWARKSGVPCSLPMIFPLSPARQQKTCQIQLGMRQVGEEGSDGPVIVEAPGQAEKRPRHLVPDASTATTDSQDTSCGSRMNNSGTSPDALFMPTDVVADVAATDIVPSLSSVAKESDSAPWLDCYFS